MISNASLADSYRIAVRLALAWSVIIAAVSAMLLDGGKAGRLTVAGLLLFWLCALVIICRRPRNPTRFDLHFIGWGPWAMVLGFQVIMHIVWIWRGLE